MVYMFSLTNSISTVVEPGILSRKNDSVELDDEKEGAEPEGAAVRASADMSGPVTQVGRPVGYPSPEGALREAKKRTEEVRRLPDFGIKSLCPASGAASTKTI
jgi:hypothetical protein